MSLNVANTMPTMQESKEATDGKEVPSGAEEFEKEPLQQQKRKGSTAALEAWIPYPWRVPAILLHTRRRRAVHRIVGISHLHR